MNNARTYPDVLLEVVIEQLKSVRAEDDPVERANTMEDCILSLAALIQADDEEADEAEDVTSKKADQVARFVY